MDEERNVSRYLLDVNDRLNKLKGSKADVLEVSRRGTVVVARTPCPFPCMITGKGWCTPASHVLESIVLCRYVHKPTFCV